MRIPPVSAGVIGAALVMVVSLVVAACGGGEPTRTPVSPTATQPPATATPARPAQPSPIATPTPSTPAQPSVTATPVPSTPTQPPATVTSTNPTPSAVRPAATPAPTAAQPGAMPTPVVVAGGKRGGVLNSSVQGFYISRFDTITAGGRAAVPTHSLLLNNLIWTDPYGDGGLVGDAAESWAFSDSGKVITVRVRKGIAFHDGKPLTAKDVAYNIERSWKPRAPTMTELTGRFEPVAAIDTPDDSTMRLTLSRPTNFFLTSLADSRFLVYPAHMPFPEFNEQWKVRPVGSGPFKIKEKDAEAKEVVVRNEQYWKPGLPYLDGVNLIGIGDGALVLAAYRTGKIDATSLDASFLQTAILNGTLQKEVGFVPYPIVGNVGAFHFMQKTPWTDPRVREAVDLAFDRYGWVTVGTEGQGNPLASPMLPPEMGGLWGIPAKEMETRPAYRQDKAQDIGRAKTLLASAIGDPSKVAVTIVSQDQPPYPSHAQFLADALRQLGLKANVSIVAAAVASQTARTGDFDFYTTAYGPSVDDPSDYVGPFVLKGGVFNYGNWFDPDLESLFVRQDQTQDAAERAKLIRDIQERVMQDRFSVLTAWTKTFVGHNKAVKNYPPKLRFTFDSRFRWEQVWLER